MTTSDQPQSQQTFLKFIAYLQIIGIILVVFGHSFHEFPDGEGGKTLLIYRLFYNFRMPLFLFVSGFLMVYTTFKRKSAPPSIKEFTLKKIKRLLVPYVVLTLVTYFPRAAMSGIADDSLPMTAKGWLQSLYVTEMLPIPFFWFIQASFLLLILLYMDIWFCKRHNVPMTITFGAILVLFVLIQFVNLPSPEIFGIYRVVNLGFFFVLGAAYCEFYHSVNRVLPLDNIASLITFFALWLVSFLWWEGSEYTRISPLFGIPMCISFAKLLVKYRVGVLDHLIGANYLIFLLSWYFNVFAQQFLAHFVTIPWWVHTILSLTFGIYIPWLGYRYLRDNQHRKAIRHISFLLGQAFKGKKNDGPK